jgi:tetraacyldisaccharide 4'-kinase
MIIYLRILLLPFSLIYSFIIFLRNFLFDKGFFKSYKINKPVISIGNITTGGTGKSPFTIFLAKYFFKMNLKPAIVSRGYKRKSNEIETVFDGTKITSTLSKCGDEPLMMANDLSLTHTNFFIVTGSNRVKTSNFVTDKFNPDVIILDDAYQHRKIKRNLDIVLIDAEEMINNKLFSTTILPAGNLRENFGNLAGADIIIQNNKFNNYEKLGKLKKFGKDILRLNYLVKGFYDINNNPYEINGKNIRAFAGIAKPESFFSELKKYNPNKLDLMTFKDHYNYSTDDISKISENVAKQTFIITTEKDFIKIKYFDAFLKYFNVLFMKIELILEESDKLFNIIEDKILTKNN